MNILNINKLEFGETLPELNEISARLDKILPGNKIDTISWKEFRYKPEVSFSMVYTSNEILLKYYVTEQYFKAEKTESNQMVCEDSCVEFFVSPSSDGLYYNFEFNGIGTCLLGTGTGRENNTKTDPEVITKIRRMTSIGQEPLKERTGKFYWTITIAMPFEIFFHHRIKNLTGTTFRANFYKCGDLLPVPHYITWNPVGTAKPDFHRPEYFGILKFV
jgi:hypothetical protein